MISSRTRAVPAAKRTMGRVPTLKSSRISARIHHRRSTHSTEVELTISGVPPCSHQSACVLVVIAASSDGISRQEPAEGGVSLCADLREVNKSIFSLESLIDHVCEAET